MSVYIAKLVQKRELFVQITRSVGKNVNSAFEMRKKAQKSDLSVYIVKLVQKREVFVKNGNLLQKRDFWVRFERKKCRKVM